ncbi:cellulose synthase [Nonomuraea indica]|uniref:cellulose synthase n=1 Tax=Nonomuraea indica TaxID=1581193 RepID=UPI000C7A4CBF|nr:cellulose synthase [Nonomuraea indica]
MTFDQIAWLPLCAGVTIAGLVLSFLAFRRRGAAAGTRVAAWALLPLAAYLTGALQALWTIGTTIVGFVTSLVFNPVVWAGVAVAGLSVVLFVVSGVLRGRKLAKASQAAPAQPRAQGGAQGQAQGRPQAPAAPPQTGKPAVAAPQERKSDDDFSDIEDILRRRGIS